MQSLPLLGELSSLGAALIWAISLTMFSKYGSNSSPIALNLYKNLLALAGFVLAALWLGGFQHVTSTQAIFLGLSGLLGLALGDTALFAALSRLGAQKTGVSQSVTPVITCLLAFFVIDESLSYQQVFGIALSVSATILVLTMKEDSSPARLLSGSFFALIAAFCQASAVVLIRSHMQELDVFTGTALRVIPACLFLLIVQGTRRRLASDFKRLFSEPGSFYHLSLAALMGTFLGLLLMSTGAKYTKAGISSALTATYPLWLIPLSVKFLGEPFRKKSVLYTSFAIVGIWLMNL